MSWPVDSTDVWKIYWGDDFNYPVVFKDANPLSPDDRTTDTVTNITGRTYTAMLRKNRKDLLPIATFTVSITDGPNGAINVFLAHAITSTIPEGQYVWDIQESIAGVPDTPVRGTAKVSQDVTR